MEKYNLLKNKSVLFGLGVVVCVILLAISYGSKNQLPIDNNSSPEPQPSRLEFVDLNEEKRRQAAAYRQTIASALPIYFEDFPTSVGINTTINIFFIDSDPSDVVHLEVYGLSFLNEDSSPNKNPNVTAYKESYLKAMNILKEKNIDPKRLTFVYSDKEYVVKTTLKWINSLGLKP